MVRTAQREQVVGLMISAGFARAEMMDVDERRVPAARHLAAVPIAQQHRATNGRWNRLRGALPVWPCRRLALAREFTTHVGFVAAIGAAGGLILGRALATRWTLR